MIFQILLFFIASSNFGWAHAKKEKINFTENEKQVCSYFATINSNQYVDLANPGYPKVNKIFINCLYKVETPNPEDKVYMRCYLKTLKIPDRKCR